MELVYTSKNHLVKTQSEFQFYIKSSF